LKVEMCGSGFRASCGCKGRKNSCEFTGGHLLEKAVSGWESIQALLDRNVQSIFQPAEETVSSSALKGVIKRRKQVYTSNGTLIVFMVMCGFEHERDGIDAHFKVGVAT